jgi:hypothetical protein
MNKEKESLITKLCILVFIAHSLCLMELIDVLLFKNPLITFFLIILTGCYYFNLKLFKKIFIGNTAKVVT